MVFRGSSCQEVFLTSSGLNPLVKTTSSKPVHWPESHTTWFMGLLLVHGEQIQANMRDNPKYCKPFNSRSIYHRSLVISQHLEVSYKMEVPPNHPSHGWPWLSIETYGDLGIPDFGKRLNMDTKLYPIKSPFLLVIYPLNHDFCQQWHEASPAPRCCFSNMPGIGFLGSGMGYKLPGSSSGWKW
jgi:hypothetical protein